MLVKGATGVGVTKQIFAIKLFFTILKILVTDWISHVYFMGVITAQLWWHLSNMKVIPRTYQVLLQVNKKDWKDLSLWSLTYSFHLSMVVIISQEMIHIKTCLIFRMIIILYWICMCILASASLENMISFLQHKRCLGGLASPFSHI